MLKLSLLLAVLSSVASAAPALTDGVYTAAQAARGKTLYAERCAECHGDDLKEEDEKTKPIAGEKFLKRWDGKTLGRLIDTTKRSMPPDTPNSLSRKETVELVAYVLSVNGFPAGPSELDPASPALKEIVFTPKK